MDLKLSRDPLMKNPSCLYCGKVFNAPGVHLQLAVGLKTIPVSLCQPCFNSVPLLETTVSLEHGLVFLKR